MGTQNDTVHRCFSSKYSLTCREPLLLYIDPVQASNDHHMKDIAGLPIQLHQKIWVSFWSVSFMNIFIDVKWATECVPVLEKTPLLGCIFRFAYSKAF